MLKRFLIAAGGQSPDPLNEGRRCQLSASSFYRVMRKKLSWDCAVNIGIVRDGEWLEKCVDWGWIECSGEVIARCWRRLELELQEVGC